VCRWRRWRRRARAGRPALSAVGRAQPGAPSERPALPAVRGRAQPGAPSGRPAVPAVRGRAQPGAPSGLARSSFGTSQELLRDVLLFLLYEDVPSQELPRDVLCNLLASTYITFPAAQAEPPLVRYFWARMKQAIRQQ